MWDNHEEPHGNLLFFFVFQPQNRWDTQVNIDVNSISSRLKISASPWPFAKLVVVQLLKKSTPQHPTDCPKRARNGCHGFRIDVHGRTWGAVDRWWVLQLSEGWGPVVLNLMVSIIFPTNKNGQVKLWLSRKLVIWYVLETQLNGGATPYIGWCSQSI